MSGVRGKNDAADAAWQPGTQGRALEVIGASRLSLLARVARLEASQESSAMTIAATIAAARARGPQPPTQSRDELERIVADEPPEAMRSRLARAQSARALLDLAPDDGLLAASFGLTVSTPGAGPTIGAFFFHLDCSASANSSMLQYTPGDATGATHTLCFHRSQTSAWLGARGKGS